MKNILAVANLSVRFGDFLAIERIDFSIDEGDFLMILGPNGAGKSVLMKAILGLLPYSGEVRIFDKKIDEVRSQIGYVPQYIDFDRTFPITVEEVVELGLIGRKVGDVAGEVEKILEQVGLLEKKKELFGSLSGGQMRRALIARALIGRPKLLFMDEPLAGVDVVGESNFYEMMEKWHKQFSLTTVMISHDYDLVSKIASKILCLNKTKVCFDNPGNLDKKNFEATFGQGFDMHRH